MRVAVLMSGQFRTLDKCWDSMHKHVWSVVGKYNLFIHLAPCTFHEQAIAQSLWPRALLIEANPIFPDHGWKRPETRCCSTLTSDLLQLYGQKQVNAMMRSVEEQEGPYDWVIRMRTDTLFTHPMEDLAECDPSCIYIPKFCNFWGYNDRFAFGGSGPMNAYMNKFYDVHRQMSRPGALFHAEGVLKEAIDHAGITVKRTDAQFGLLRPLGKIDGPVYDAEQGDIMPEGNLNANQNV